MKLKFSWWSAILLLLILLMVASLFGVVPYVTTMDIFWLVITVFCVWLIMKVFFSEKKS